MSEAPSIQPGLSKDQYEDLAVLLESIDPQFPLGTRVFDQIVRVSPFAALELVLGINLKRSSRQFLLAQREANDPGWPGQWAIAGTVLRASDIGLPVERLMNKELLGAELESLSVVGTVLGGPGGGRAPCVSIVTTGELRQGSELDRLLAQDGIGLFPVDQLPENIIDGHRKLVSMVNSYLCRANPQGMIGLLAQTLKKSAHALMRLEPGPQKEELNHDLEGESTLSIIMADPSHPLNIYFDK